MCLQGNGGRTHLVSPAMAAAAAVTGCLTDVRKLELNPSPALAPIDSRTFLIPVRLHRLSCLGSPGTRLSMTAANCLLTGRNSVATSLQQSMAVCARRSFLVLRLLQHLQLALRLALPGFPSSPPCPVRLRRWTSRTLTRT